MSKNTGFVAALTAGVLIGTLGTAQAATHHHAKRHHKAGRGSMGMASATHGKRPYDQPRGVANVNAGTTSTGTSGVGTDTSATGATQSPVADRPAKH